MRLIIIQNYLKLKYLFFYVDLSRKKDLSLTNETRSTVTHADPYLVLLVHDNNSMTTATNILCLCSLVNSSSGKSTPRMYRCSLSTPRITKARVKSVCPSTSKQNRCSCPQPVWERVPPEMPDRRLIEPTVGTQLFPRICMYTYGTRSCFM